MKADLIRKLKNLPAILIYSLLLVSFSSIFRVFFPLPSQSMGHDYALAMPAYLDGYFWFRNNGLSPPWFTPSFCAGQPFFADPQSSYYSLIQGLAFFVDPVTASFWSLLITASLAYWGGFLLMRCVFSAGHATAILTGGMLMFNAFLPSRMAIGHLGYQGFALLSWIALLLIVPLRNRIDGISASVATGLLLTYWVHCGMGTLMIPAGIGVLLIALLHGLRGGDLRIFFGRSCVAIVVALCLSAAKLAAAMSLMGNFSRDFYLLPGMRSIPDTLLVIFSSLFLSAEHTYLIAKPRMENVQWALQPHEWGFGFTPALGVLILVLAATFIVRRVSFLPRNLLGWIMLALLLACLAWPVAFNTYEPSWNGVLKSLPILGSASTPTRWIIIYIPFLAVFPALMMEKLAWTSRIQWLLTLSALFFTVVFTTIEPRDFYYAQNYDVRPVTLADAAVREGNLEPQIRELGTEVSLRTRNFEKILVSNDTFIAGISQVFCYNPLFGYRLEKFSPDGLVAGDVLQIHDGYLNLKNPSCYIFPRENHCKPGDRFRADQIEEARRFISYRPFSFLISARQEWANFLTWWSLVGVTIFLAGWMVMHLQEIRLRRR